MIFFNSLFVANSFYVYCMIYHFFTHICIYKTKFLYPSFQFIEDDAFESQK